MNDVVNALRNSGNEISTDLIDHGNYEEVRNIRQSGLSGGNGDLEMISGTQNHISNSVESQAGETQFSATMHSVDPMDSLVGPDNYKAHSPILCASATPGISCVAQ